MSATLETKPALPPFEAPAPVIVSMKDLQAAMNLFNLGKPFAKAWADLLYLVLEEIRRTSNSTDHEFKTFTGFRGVAALMEIGGVKFIVVARTPLALEQLHRAILPDASEPFNPAMCKKSILISSDLLPEPKKP